MSLDVLSSTYFSYAHSIISCGIVFWGNSSYSEDIFKIQKRIIRIIMNSRRNAPCPQLFKDLNILPLKSQYIYTPSLYLLPTYLLTPWSRVLLEKLTGFVDNQEIPRIL